MRAAPDRGRRSLAALATSLHFRGLACPIFRWVQLEGTFLVALWNLIKKEREQRLGPESRWVLRLRDGAIELIVSEGESHRILLSELVGIAIETNDTGPFSADVWWLLFGKGDKVAVAFPQGSTGEKDVVDVLMALPGCDHEAMINAMTCTTNQVFPIWRAPGL